jgi:glycosyltransferase involved in cell wall biosynthesis
MIAYEAADVTIAPTADDMVAQSLLESLAVGTPVLASASNPRRSNIAAAPTAVCITRIGKSSSKRLRLLMTNNRLRSRLGKTAERISGRISMGRGARPFRSTVSRARTR